MHLKYFRLHYLLLFWMFLVGWVLRRQLSFNKKERKKDPPSSTFESKDLTYGSRKTVDKANFGN